MGVQLQQPGRPPRAQVVALDTLAVNGSTRVPGVAVPAGQRWEVKLCHVDLSTPVIPEIWVAADTDDLLRANSSATGVMLFLDEDSNPVKLHTDAEGRLLLLAAAGSYAVHINTLGAS